MFNSIYGYGNPMDSLNFGNSASPLPDTNSLIWGSLSGYGERPSFNSSLNNRWVGNSQPILGFGGTPIAGTTTGGTPATPSLMDRIFGTKDQPGLGGFALGALQAGVGAGLGWKQYGLAEKTLAENRRQFELNYDAQRKLTNAQLEDRQRRRNEENPNTENYVTYMGRYGIT